MSRPDARSERNRWSDAYERFSAWFYGGSVTALAAWMAALVVFVIVLAWFFVLSPYAAPAAPVYAEF